VDAALPAPARPAASDARQQHFLSILPRIELRAQIYFRHLKCPGRKEDAVAQVVAVTWKGFLPATARGTVVGVFVSALAGNALPPRTCRDGPLEPCNPLVR
jgi:hypothetical protein